MLFSICLTASILSQSIRCKEVCISFVCLLPKVEVPCICIHANMQMRFGETIIRFLRITFDMKLLRQMSARALLRMQCRFFFYLPLFCHCCRCSRFVKINCCLELYFHSVFSQRYFQLHSIKSYLKGFRPLNKEISWSVLIRKIRTMVFSTKLQLMQNGMIQGIFKIII